MTSANSKPAKTSNVNIASPDSPDFRLLRTHDMLSLNIKIEEYEHTATGASHIHIAADSDENVFLVALRTVPEDSTGVAHMLEHTVLCGSEKYPVRDPFFMMIRRSLNTFMNAMTSSDWTAYPFASQNRKDFDNLLDVYLDAVFFSRIDPLDFAQEGHRIEFESKEDATSPLVYKGVVFNEMKGAMSSVPSQLWQTLCKYLYPTTTYHFNSGGEPDCITDLSYEELLHFYKTHYHPSNAIFMTFGNIPALELQDRFQSQVLNRFERSPEKISVPEEKRYQAPVRIQESYPFDDEKNPNSDSESIDQKTHVVMAWLLGKSTDLESSMKAQLMAGVLFDNSASPLQQALETTDLATAPSPLCGLDDSQYELVFACGVEGTDAKHQDAVENLILDTLQKVAEEGVPFEDLEASLHQFELQQREIGGDSYPYGLQLLMAGLNAATHYGDPIALIDIDPVLKQLREEIKDPNFIKDLVKEYLLDNQHRVRITLTPDSSMSARKIDAEKQQLEAIRVKLSEKEKLLIIEKTAALSKRQAQVDDDSILPKVGLEDIPESVRKTEGETNTEKKIAITCYDAGTNGLSYQQAIFNLPELNLDELSLLPLYSICLTELGNNSTDYLSVQRRQSQIVGSLNAFTSIRSQIDDVQQSLGNFVISAKSLSVNHREMTELMADTIYSVRFDEVNRVRELVSQVRARKEQSVTGNGHGLAMAASVAGLSPSSQLSHKLSGLTSIQDIKQLDDSLKNPAQLKLFCESLEALHNKICRQEVQFLLISDKSSLKKQRDNLIDVWERIENLKAANPADLNKLILPYRAENAVKQAWVTGTQVNFCAKAFPTVPMPHKDAAPLSVLGGFLRNGYLHSAIREQGGAYGSGAQQDSNCGAFKFFSYRDPRLVETLDDFDKSVDWLLSSDHQWQAVEEAILGVISSIDKPASPAGEAKKSFHAELSGRGFEERKLFRSEILKVTAKDLQSVGEKYLRNKNASTVIITNKNNQSIAQEIELDIVNL